MRRDKKAGDRHIEEAGDDLESRLERIADILATVAVRIIRAGQQALDEEQKGETIHGK
jgi:hypothetical protein